MLVSVLKHAKLYVFYFWGAPAGGRGGRIRKLGCEGGLEVTQRETQMIWRLL